MMFIIIIIILMINAIIISSSSSSSSMISMINVMINDARIIVGDHLSNATCLTPVLFKSSELYSNLK